MNEIQAENYTIEIGNLTDSSFAEVLSSYNSCKKIILIDDNTKKHCLDFLITQFEALENAEVILLPSGEENKVIEVCTQVWEALSEYKISRNDLIINLGGGVVTDMGGFMASIYKRGIDFINIPTSLLAMVDASVGGKTGVDLGAYKNQLGLFANPQAIFVDPSFLASLPEEELKNGLAEMLKHGFIADELHWNKLQNINLEEISVDLIEASIKIKNEIVLSDPKESGRRKLLNFGHTVGHAIEGFLLHQSKIAHGQAVALGMLIETQMAFELNLLPEKELNTLKQVVLRNFNSISLKKESVPALFDLMQQDKKNSDGKVLCVLPTAIGKGKWDVVITFSDFEKAILPYLVD